MGGRYTATTQGFQGGDDRLALMSPGVLSFFLSQLSEPQQSSTSEPLSQPLSRSPPSAAAA